MRNSAPGEVARTVGIPLIPPGVPEGLSRLLLGKPDVLTDLGLRRRSGTAAVAAADADAEGASSPALSPVVESPGTLTL